MRGVRARADPHGTDTFHRPQIPGGIGAYSDSRGALAIRKEVRLPASVRICAARRAHSSPPAGMVRTQVAQYIKNRDGLKEDPNADHIFLTGARLSASMPAAPRSWR